MKDRDQDLVQDRSTRCSTLEAQKAVNRRLRELRRREPRSVFDRLADNPGYVAVRIDTREALR